MSEIEKLILGSVWINNNLIEDLSVPIYIGEKYVLYRVFIGGEDQGEFSAKKGEFVEKKVRFDDFARSCK